MMCCVMKVGMFFAALFVLCFAWSWALGSAELKAVHLSMMQVSFLWFTGMNLMSFVLGLAQSFVWGVVVAGIWGLVNSSCKGDKCGGNKCEGGKCEDGKCCDK